MILCKVKGTLTSQQKEDCLVGKKLLLCEAEGSREKIVAVDLTGATVGSDVLVSRRCAKAPPDLIDDYIVAIVDDSPHRRKGEAR